MNKTIVLILLLDMSIYSHMHTDLHMYTHIFIYISVFGRVRQKQPTQWADPEMLFVEYPYLVVFRSLKSQYVTHILAIYCKQA